MLRLFLALALAMPATAAVAAERLALFPFEFVDTSPEPPRPDELARLDALTEQARQRFVAAGFELVDLQPVEAALQQIAALRDCNGCDLKLAREAGAGLSGVGWVQKVSNLILNINLQIRDVATRKLLAAGSVDIRGNNDESWRRGLKYLLDHRILPQPAPPP